MYMYIVIHDSVGEGTCLETCRLRTNCDGFKISKSFSKVPTKIRLMLKTLHDSKHIPHIKVIQRATVLKSTEKL